MYTYQDMSADTHYPSAGGPRSIPRAGICLHATAGTWSLPHLQRREDNPEQRSSADYLIGRMGDIYQVTRVGYYSHHAGKALWRLRPNLRGEVNQALVSIEIESLDRAGDVYTNAQYIATAALMRRLYAYHRIALPNVTTHAEIALPRGRKVDPANLDWAILTRELVAPSREQGVFRFPEVMP